MKNKISGRPTSKYVLLYIVILYLAALMIGGLLAAKSVPLAVAHAADSTVATVHLQVDDQPVDTRAWDAEPYINSDGRTMFPLRYGAIALGVADDTEHIEWEPKTRTVTLRGNGHEIILQIGKKIIQIDGIPRMMDTEAILRNNRTFIPAKFVAESLDANVYWDAKTRTAFFYRAPTDTALYEMDETKLRQQVNTDNFRADQAEQLLYLREGDNSDTLNYLLSDTAIPDVNRKIYDTVVGLMGDKSFVEVSYGKYDDATGLTPNELDIGIGNTRKLSLNGFRLFDFLLLDTGFYNARKAAQVPTFSDKVSVRLVLGALCSGTCKENYITPYFADKFENALKALFNEINGKQIAAYLIGYIANKAPNYTSFQGKSETKIFGNIQVDLINDPHGSNTYIYFSYIE